LLDALGRVSRRLAGLARSLSYLLASLPTSL
jgi:hypothetical protein